VFDTPFAQSRQPAYLAIGTRDSYYDAATLADLTTRRPAFVRVLDGADHGLDVRGDLAATLRAIGQVVEDASAFFLTGSIPGLG
jgi:hypothetical protein